MIATNENPTRTRDGWCDMARPPLDIGTFGKIYESARVDGTWMPLHRVPDEATPEKWKASARYRPADGKTRPMEREGRSPADATKRLKKALAEALNTKSTSKLTGSSRISALITPFLERTQRECVGTTYDRYKGRLDKHVTPAIGDLLIRECTAARLNVVFSAYADAGLSAETRRGIRTVVSSLLQEAVDLEIFDSNPVRNLRKIRGGSKKVVAYDAEQIADFFARVDGDSRAVHADLPDLLRFIFGTGARFGEALALRWRDLNFTDSVLGAEDVDGDTVEIPPNGVWFNGNLVHVKGKGIVRHEGKTTSSRGTMVLPEFLVTLLLVRRPAGSGLDDPVFPSNVWTWRSPSNVQKQFRRMRFRIGYPKFTSHIGRKSVATALDKAGHSAREVAAILRHKKPSMTQDRYMAMGEPNPRAAASLDYLHSATQNRKTS